MKINQNKFLKKLSQIPEPDKSFIKLEDTKDILLIIDEDDQMIDSLTKTFFEFLNEKGINFETIRYTLAKKPKQALDNIYYIKNLKSLNKDPKFQKLKNKIFDTTILITRNFEFNTLYLLKSIPSKMKVSPDFEINVADITFIIKSDYNQYFDAIKSYLTHKNN